MEKEEMENKCKFTAEKNNVICNILRELASVVQDGDRDRRYTFSSNPNKEYDLINYVEHLLRNFVEV